MGLKLSMTTAAALMLAGLVAAGPAVAEPAEPAPPVSPSPEAPPVAPGGPATDQAAPADPGAPAAPATVIDKDGTYKVGTDILPGVYGSGGPLPEGTCSWRRIAPLTPEGEPGETLDRAFTKQPQVVEIKPDDGYFKTTGCQTWQLTNQPPPGPGTHPAVAALQWKLYLDTLNRNAAQYQANPPQPAPTPAGTP
ncbi:hypothetical protein V4U86_12925 [Mycobacterium sp. AMU20-3851]|uniref:hypothetical protein n=1 Tax=Mycobacterium sp. AMU20-3851 TaxID=3122055 RepID=UPI0037548A33